MKVTEGAMRPILREVDLSQFVIVFSVLHQVRMELSLLALTLTLQVPQHSVFVILELDHN